MLAHPKNLIHRCPNRLFCSGKSVLFRHEDHSGHQDIRGFKKIPMNKKDYMREKL